MEDEYDEQEMIYDGILYYVQQLHEYNDLKASNEEFTINNARETKFFVAKSLLVILS